jgi:hypothetical protein
MSIQPASSIHQDVVLSEINWLGSANSNWNDPLNWSGNEIPTALSNVAVLPGQNQPVLSDDGFCNSLTLSSSSNLILGSSSTLRVEHNLTILASAELFLSNSATSKASLITLGEVSGKIRSEYQVARNTEMFVSAPVADALSGVFMNMYLRKYDEPASNWGNYIVPTDVDLISMQGYELYSPYSDTRYFEGVPNHGEMTQDISSMNDGWNLIGNPYPCYLDWQSDDQSGLAWQRDDISKAIYYLDAAGSGNYSVYLPGQQGVSINNGSRYIPPMQGFFVKAKHEGVVKVNKQAIAAITEQPMELLQNTALKFRVSGNGFSDESVVRFEPASTFSFDDDYDAYKIPGTGAGPAIYTSDPDGIQMAVNTMPSLSSSLVVPISVKSTVEGEYTLQISGASNFEFRYPLTLEDKLTQSFVDLRIDSVYTFNLSPGSDPMRFVLHFDVIEGIDQNSALHPEITLTDGNLKIGQLGGQNCSIDVIGLDGKQLLKTTALMASEIQIPFQGNHGIYIVKVTTKSTCYAHKLYAE